MNGLDYDTTIKVCEKCGDPIQKDIVILNVLRRVPIVCSCRKKELEEKAIEDENKEKQIRLNSIFKNSLMDEKFKQCTFENWNHDIGSEKIFNICKDDVTFEDVLKQVFDSYNLSLNTTQYVLIGSTIRSYLSYLFDEDRITYEFKDNKMLWHQK